MSAEISSPPPLDPAPGVQPLSVESLRQLLDATSAVIAVKDRQGRYIYCNQAFLALIGCRAEECVGRSDLEIFSPAMAAQLRANDQQVLAEKRELVFEESLEIGGKEYTFKTRKYPLLDAEGAPWAVCLTAEDVTEARRTDQALRRVALGIAAASGPEVFDLTVSSVAAVLGVDFAFIAASEEGAGTSSLSTLAMFTGNHGADVAGGPYKVLGTPCENVLNRGFEYHSERAHESFPADSMLARHGFVSYAGYPLIDSRGAPSGVLSICHSGALPPAALVESILAIFAVRTAAELERMRMDRALRESEQSYRAIFEGSEDCIFIHDFDTGAFVDVNPRACESYGYDHDTLLGMDPADLSTGEPPYTQADAAQHLQRARNGEIVRFEWHRRNADGSTRWDEVCLKHVRLAGVDRILAVTRDITERQEREQALARSEDRLRATVAAALDCIIAMDSGGRIREFNPAAEACFGYRRSEVLGRPLGELIVPARLRAAHQQGMERYLKGGAPRMLGKRVELTAMRADGSEFPVELTIAEAQGVGDVVFIGYLRDLTQQRVAEQDRAQLEAQLRQAQKMEAIGHLTGGIAHDFNNILTGIMGYLGMAEERVRGGDARLIQYLQRARHSGLRATDLIQQMLTFSRGKRGHPRLLAPAPLVEDGLRLVRAAMPSTLVLATDLDTSVPAVKFDPVQLEQVLMNLCINARDAMGAQGTLEIRLHCVDPAETVCTSCHAAVKGRFVELAVSDSGPGVPADVLLRMFEPFFSTKSPGAGSGMGLATVHGIVHEHGGHVLVANREIGGATFRVLMPALDEVPNQAGPLREEPENLSRKATVLAGRVLLVDDDHVVLAFMTELLGDWGLEVASFDGPLAAEAACSTQAAFDAAIIDYTMPQLTGLELARRIQALQPGLPVLLYTGYAEGLEQADLSGAGIRTRLSKPVDTTVLFRQLEEILDPT
jgi:PAS domain S-box-containing protein